MKASIIIRTYNEEEKLGACLQAVFSQQTTFPFEVIIVDSESTDDTVRIASQFHTKILKIKKRDFTYGRALNIGCEAAEGEYLIFLSGHAIPTNKEWLLNLTKNFSISNNAGVYGKQIPFADCNPLEKREQFDSWAEDRKIQRDDPFFSNTNAAIKKEIWLKIPFNEELPYAEDQEWAVRAQRQGLAVVYDPRPAVFHSHNESVFKYSIRTYRKIRALYLIHGIGMAEKNLQYWARGYGIKRDIIYIRAHHYSFFWIIRSVVRNGLVSLLAILCATLRTPHGATWLLRRFLRFISPLNPLLIAYKISFILKRHFPSYARLIAFIKKN